MFLVVRNPAASVKALAWRLTSDAWQIFRNRQNTPLMQARHVESGGGCFVSAQHSVATE